MTDQQCPVCAKTSPVPHREVARVSLVRCTGCDLVYREAPPESFPHAMAFGESFFAGDVKGGYGDYLRDESVTRHQARDYLRLIERFSPPPGRLFDGGCATGFLLDEARRRGWVVSGCDASPWAAAWARDRLGLSVTTELIDGDGNAGNSASVVTLLNVIEHCERPRRAEEACHERLVPGGLLLVETWDRDSLLARLAGSRWHQWTPASVVTWFNRRSLHALFPPDRWEWLRYGRATRWISLRRGLEVLGVPASGRLAGVVLPYRLGDLVILLLRRRRAHSATRQSASG